MRNIGLVFLAVLGTVATAAAQTEVPKKAQPESPGVLGASLGANLLELGQTRDGDAIYIAHGYAAAEIKDTKSADPSNANGEFSFRLKELCLRDAQAQLNPLGLIPAEMSGGGEASPPYYLIGVKVELEETQKETCTFVVKVSYGLRLPPKSRLTQIGYTVFLTGAKRTPESKPAVLPRTPL